MHKNSWEDHSKLTLVLNHECFGVEFPHNKRGLKYEICIGRDLNLGF